MALLRLDNNKIRISTRERMEDWNMETFKVGDHVSVKDDFINGEIVDIKKIWLM